ncbi:hypothetical protein [Paracidobacterium acidisoli]|uniref:Uncharacterized protein n=1 Tax=Paracidobacterium acidisoli TaxID=2303751 RepID=A0A372IMP2_9BACT|nr:hypothetical protein [Paracidobacterium acidisoli]MBT9331851.1 hypothetical protein [Paracidobacterium acidisoli]
MPDRTFKYNGAVFKVAEGEPEFDGGAGHAVAEVDGCKAVTVSQKFTCGAALLLTLPSAAMYRFGFVQVVRSASRIGYYTDGCVQWRVKNLPLYDASVRPTDVVFPFTTETETAMVSGTKVPTPQFQYVRTNDRLRIGFPLEFPNAYLGRKKDTGKQKLLMVEEKVELTTWLAARDESLRSDMKTIVPLGMALWEVDVEVHVDTKTGTIREHDTKVNSSIGGWEFCRDGEPMPTLPAEIAVLAQRQYWVPDHGTRVRFHQNLLPGNFYKEI